MLLRGQFSSALLLDIGGLHKVKLCIKVELN